MSVQPPIDNFLSGKNDDFFARLRTAIEDYDKEVIEYNQGSIYNGEEEENEELEEEENEELEEEENEEENGSYYGENEEGNKLNREDLNEYYEDDDEDNEIENSNIEELEEDNEIEEELEDDEE